MLKIKVKNTYRLCKHVFSDAILNTTQLTFIKGEK